jgi:hypothetical protein
MAYTKLHQELVTSTIWREPHSTRILWVTMLAMATKHGEVRASIPGLADLARITLDECEAALQAFLSPDKYSRTPDYEGRRIEKIDGGWMLLNHPKYRLLCSKEDEKEATALRVARHRARKKEATDSNGHVTPRNAKVTDDVDIAEAEAEVIQPPLTRKRVSTPPSKPDAVSAQVWQDWLALRKAKKAPVSATVLAGAEVEAGKAGMSLDAFLSVWCSRGSQGLQAEWLKPHELPARPAANGHAEPEWRREQRERNEAFLGPYAAKRRSNVIEMEASDAATRILD